MFPTILFFIFAARAGVRRARRHPGAQSRCTRALLLVLCFFNSAVIWLLLDAEFLGIVLVLVYVGAVMVLFLFVVMMLDINSGGNCARGSAGYWPLAVAVAGFVVFAIVNVIVVKHLGGMSMKNGAGDCRRLFQYARPWARPCSPAMPIPRRSRQSFCWWRASRPSF